MRVWLVAIIAATLLGCGRARPPMPRDACFARVQTAKPSYSALTADGRIVVAALFGQMDYKRNIADDHGTWSAHGLTSALRKLGFRRTAHAPALDTSRYELVIRNELTVIIDVIGPRSLPHLQGHKVVGPKLAHAINTYEVIYFNGHAFEGNMHELKRMHPAPSDTYRIVFLDTCFSQQHYSVPLVRASKRIDVISNTERSVTGSVDSFIDLLASLIDAAASHRNVAWVRLLAPMNRAASQRAVQRVMSDPRTEHADPERYGLSALCGPGLRHGRQ